VEEAIAAMPCAGDGTRRLRYTNPLDGGPVMPTLDASLWQLTREQESNPYRTTANAVCVVLDGEGKSTVGGVVQRWGRRDIFTLPHWSWIAHRAASEPARLLIISDCEVLRRLGLLREEVR
jgi:gentisate 1,2-dioxygenase